jgi:RHS repeat-associated protein
VRRRLASVMAVVLAAGLIVVVEPPAPAAAAGPSVDLPATPSVPVSPVAMEPVPPDQAAMRELRGDQPAGSAPRDGAGTPTATSLSPSATWGVSGQTGDFTWSYPLRVPPVPGGLVPELALSYQSSAVDGRTSATNNQASWVGDGWDLNPGFVERTYGVCAFDKEGGTVAPQTNDLCWRSDNATAAYGGGGGALIRDDRTGVWRPEQDDGSRVERLTGAGNGARGGEYWKITTLDGTQYFFGSRQDASSTWTAPVFGDDAGEPCHASTFAASHCTQGWRWNLDKVVDARGNMILLDYQAETNSYGLNLRDTAVSYVRGGTLSRISYGLHIDVAAPAAARVEFAVADRCVLGSTCALDRPANWPDTPLSARCVAATCPDKHSPTFWSTRRLASVTTQVRQDGSYTDVDRWTLDQQFPDPGDGEKAALWLKSITHTGLVRGSVGVPPVTFQGTQMANRVYQGDGLSPLIRYRITGIISESGGVISVNYASPDCVPGQSMPANPESNTLRCFPVTWARPDFAERTDWFHKYVVASIVVSDRISSNPDELYRYEYLDGVAWHYTQSEFTPPDKRTWDEFRGYGRVRIRHGRTDDPAGPVTMSEQRFYRGMHGDRLPGGGSRQVTLTDSEGGARPDHDWLQGFGYEAVTYLGESATVVAKTLTDPSWQGPTASRGPYHAYLVRPGTVRAFTALEGGRRQETRLTTSYDERGLPTTVDDRGNVAVAGDDICTRTSYDSNPTRWWWLRSREQTVSVNCDTTPRFPADAIADARYTHDDHGTVTQAQVLEEHTASGPVYTTVSTADHDLHGRPLETTDAIGRTVQMAYTPATGGPTTEVTVTDPKGFITSTSLDPAWGQPTLVTDPNQNTTRTEYDALGRITQVWQPDRPHPQFTASYRFSYQVNRDAPTVITTTRVGANGTYVSTNELYDGWYRLRQVQVPAPGGGRLLVDTRYDTQGRVYLTTNPYFHDAPVDTTLWEASTVDIPGSTATGYDGAGRPVASIFQAGAVERWRTTAAYGGDRTHVTPPAGGTATTTVVDARGRTVELHQYRAPTPTGPAEVTRYAYTPAGQLASLTDPAGNAWRYRYDLRGRRIWADDPDKGTGTFGYDDAGQLLTATDARGQLLAYAYDELGRRVSIRDGGPDGRLLAQWTYDTVARGRGRPATATSYDAGGNAYTTEVLSYTARYQPRRAQLTIPSSEGLLAGTYPLAWAYNPDGSLAGESYPAAGELSTEEVFHTYDDFGRPLTTYGGPAGSTVTYASLTSYTKFGEPQRLQLGTGTRRAWLTQLYDSSTRRVDRTIVDAEVARPMQADIHYAYDPAGNILSIADTVVDRPADRQCFRYDHLRRLTEAWTPGGGCETAPSVSGLAGPVPYWQSYTYDTAGNRRTEVRRAATGDITRTYAYPAAGQDRPHALASITSAGPGVSGTETYAYDEAGNTESRGEQQFDWDEFGRLASVTEAGQSTSYVYSANGERLLRREPGATTLYLGSQEIRLDHATGVRTATRYYTHGGAAVAVRAGAGLTWLFADHHGTAQVAVNAATQAVAVRRHDPFGNPRGPQPAGWPGQRGFVGGTIDPSTRLTQLGAREYDPTTGRFISVDPVLNPDSPQQFNPYAYANNNPVSMSDPTGLMTWEGDDSPMISLPPGWPGGPAKPPPPAQGSSCPPDRDCRTPAQKKLQQPALGRKLTQDELDWLQIFWNYQGSDLFTWEDALEFAGRGRNEQLIVCRTLGISGGACEAPDGAGFREFIGDITGINDIVDCANLELEGCLGLTPFGRAAKIAGKVVDAVSDAVGAARRRCNSFSAGTEVLMADGTRKPIGELEAGDKVIATDPETGEQSAQTVSAVWVHDDTLVDLQVEVHGEFDGGTGRGALVTVTTTGDHPFWDDTDRQWEPASGLTPGDELLTATGERITVIGILTYTEHEASAYNLTVSNVHTYSVIAGDTPVLVHNGGPNECDLYHGTDLDSARDIVARGLDSNTARELGGGDVFWTTTSLSDAELFAVVNPRLSDETGVVGINIRGGIDAAVDAGVISPVSQLPGAYIVNDWDGLNNLATFQLIK